MLRASVVVCTHNRSELLDGCLTTLARQQLSPDEFEVIVVDNASTDASREVVERWTTRCAHVRYCLEPTLGVSHARNHGVEAAGGKVLAFLDDDARASEQWLSAHLRAHEERAEVAAVGGPVAPRFEAEARPAWLIDELLYWYSIVQLGADRRILQPDEDPFAVNLSIRRSVAVELGGFASDLGRAGRSLLCAEEIEFLARLRRAGWSIAYEPSAAVTHLIPSERLSRRWVLRRAWAQGRSDARVEQHLAPGPAREVLGRARADIAMLAFRGWRSGLRRLASPRRAGFLVEEIARRTRHVASVRENVALALSTGGWR